MTLTKERLEQYAYDDRMCNTNDEIREMARMALAGMESVPVACIDQANLDYLKSGSDADVWPVSSSDDDSVLLYAAPQPLTTSERAELENYRNAQQVVPDEQHSERFGWTLGQWAEHVGGHHQGNDPANYYEFGSFMAVAAMLRQFGTVQQKLGWNACRAAMLQGKAEPAKTGLTLREGLAAIRISGIAIDAERILAERDSLNEPTCWCRTCRPVTVTDMRFVVCPQCGNKRCPHANDHRNVCTGSNDPGQEGSAYPAAPKEVL